jgi:hypothetical protein
LLVREISATKYVYHNIHLQTAVNYNEDYSLFKWPILSHGNKQKVNTFNIGPRRSCSFVVSPNRTINVSIECTLEPFKLHEPHELVAFFVCCGQIKNMLQLGQKIESTLFLLLRNGIFKDLIITKIYLQRPREQIYQLVI